MGLFPASVLFKPSVHQQSGRARTPESHPPGVSDSGGLGWGPGTGISNLSPGAAAGVGSSLWVALLLTQGDRVDTEPTYRPQRHSNTNPKAACPW